jgi:aryl-alcohol dehydrogenase-like predicted oxidoreductase
MRMIHTALELGCEFFDTADSYCTDGSAPANRANCATEAASHSCSCWFRALGLGFRVP